MGYGVDRGGGREAKGSSLRRSKKNPGAAAARRGGAVKAEVVISPVSVPAPQLKTADSFVDVGVALLSRKFHGQLEEVLSRASNTDCSGIVAWCSEVSRQEELLNLCKGREGILYCQLGVHPDNVDKTNKKLHSGWIETVAQMAKAPSCVGVVTGLNLRRDHATHFPQEALMRGLCQAALLLQLPVVVHLSGDEATAQLAINILKKEGVPPASVVIHNLAMACEGSVSVAAQLAKAGFYCSVSAAIIDEGLDTDPAQIKQTVACLQQFPADRILPGTHAPWHTPYSIPDEHLRTLPNETSNMEFLFETLAEKVYKGEALGSPKALVEASYANAMSIFQFGATAAPVAATGEKHADPNAASGSDDSDSDSESDKEEEATDAAATAEASPVAVEEAEDRTSQPVSIANANASTTFTCVKCRNVLFSEDLLVTHPIGAKEAPFKRGGRPGSCETALFLRLSSVLIEDEAASEGAKGKACVTVVDGEVAMCSKCNGKIGTCAVDNSCPCGKIVPSTTVRILASRVDRMEELSLEELQRRSLALQQNADQFDSSDDDGKKKKKKKGPKVNVKAQNHSNMGNYRNKDFGTAGGKQAAAKTSQLLAGADDSGDDEPTVMMKPKKSKRNKKGTRGAGSDSD